MLAVISPGRRHVGATAPSGEQQRFHLLFRTEFIRVVCFACNSLRFILQSEEKAYLTKCLISCCFVKWLFGYEERKLHLEEWMSASV